LQNGNENPFTRLPHSPQYHKILEARKNLPVFAQMDKFYDIVSSALRPGPLLEPRPYVANALVKFTKHQIVVIEGETGTGKTTQYAHLSLVS
jgi:pre-mRNA-splicing factor ATP-dependent RNA helicase DHX15/PRP43